MTKSLQYDKRTFEHLPGALTRALYAFGSSTIRQLILRIGFLVLLTSVVSTSASSVEILPAVDRDLNVAIDSTGSRVSIFSPRLNLLSIIDLHSAHTFFLGEIACDVTPISATFSPDGTAIAVSVIDHSAQARAESNSEEGLNKIWILDVNSLQRKQEFLVPSNTRIDRIYFSTDDLLYFVNPTYRDLGRDQVVQASIQTLDLSTGGFASVYVASDTGVSPTTIVAAEGAAITFYGTIDRRQADFARLGATAEALAQMGLPILLQYDSQTNATAASAIYQIVAEDNAWKYADHYVRYSGKSFYIRRPISAGLSEGVQLHSIEKIPNSLSAGEPLPLEPTFIWSFDVSADEKAIALLSAEGMINSESFSLEQRLSVFKQTSSGHWTNVLNNQQITKSSVQACP